MTSIIHMTDAEAEAQLTIWATDIYKYLLSLNMQVMMLEALSDRADRVALFCHQFGEDFHIDMPSGSKF